MFKTLRKIYSIAILVIGLVAISFVAGLYVGDLGDKKVEQDNLVLSGQEDRVDLDLFWQVWDLLDGKYVSPTSTTTISVTDEEKLYGAISGLTDSYKDPYTVFFPPKESEAFADDVNGNFEGVGMEVGIDEEVLTVVAPLKGTPADRAGIEAGDRIVEIDGKTTSNLNVEEAVLMIRGERGTKVKLTIRREGVEDPFEVSITRDVITIPAIETEITPERVFVIRLYNFSASSALEFRDALREFIKARTDKLVIDLRGNPGGYLQASIDMASWFLPEGTPIVIEEFGGDTPDVVHRSKGYNIFNEKLKLAILVNKGSASASEILAGALSESRGAILVGTNTFGKGSVQELVPLDNETSLKVTIARWFTPNGKSISEGGLSPTHEVLEEENQLKRAIEILQSI
ncbi:MAG: S41 family peptidase [Candidatus Pacebacteria bacterium]|nr:S41 family peptidase [Candidatus Paceibacterota bacterium]